MQRAHLKEALKNAARRAQASDLREAMGPGALRSTHALVGKILIPTVGGEPSNFD